jgi:hypothetical protein
MEKATPEDTRKLVDGLPTLLLTLNVGKGSNPSSITLNNGKTFPVIGGYIAGTVIDAMNTIVKDESSVGRKYQLIIQGDQHESANKHQSESTPYNPLRKYTLGIIAGGLMTLTGLSTPIYAMMRGTELSLEEALVTYVLGASGALLLGTSIGKRSFKKSQLERGEQP